jgi:hypothetical protein
VAKKLCGDCGRPFEAKRATARYCSDLCRKRAQRRPAAAAPAGGGTGLAPGPVERQVRADINALVTAHPAGEALAEMSYALARLLDNATGGMSAAAINRELRENLAELTRLAVDDGDELADELSAPELSP